MQHIVVEGDYDINAIDIMPPKWNPAVGMRIEGRSKALKGMKGAITSIYMKGTRRWFKIDWDDGSRGSAAMRGVIPEGFQAPEGDADDGSASEGEVAPVEDEDEPPRRRARREVPRRDYAEDSDEDDEALFVPDEELRPFLDEDDQDSDADENEARRGAHVAPMGDIDDEEALLNRDGVTWTPRDEGVPGDIRTHIRHRWHINWGQPGVNPSREFDE